MLHLHSIGEKIFTACSQAYQYAHHNFMGNLKDFVKVTYGCTDTKSGCSGRFRNVCACEKKS